LVELVSANSLVSIVAFPYGKPRIPFTRRVKRERKVKRGFDDSLTNFEYNEQQIHMTDQGADQNMGR
jgi:hypothetical protein